jgi:hypothetical protein
MHKINITWNSGNFALNHEVELTDSQLREAAAKGILWHAQRNREQDVVLGAFTKVNGKTKRREGWKRIDVPYSTDMAQKLSAVFSKIVLVDADDEKKQPEVAVDVLTTVSEYDRESGGDYKFTREIAKLGEKESNDTLETWLAGETFSAGTLGTLKCKPYVGPTHTEDGEAFHPDALAECRARFKTVEAEMAKKVSI